LLLLGAGAVHRTDTHVPQAADSAFGHRNRTAAVTIEDYHLTSVLDDNKIDIMTTDFGRAPAYADARYEASMAH
jgi:hypothetical protein